MNWILDRERFVQENLMPIPFFRGVAYVLDCGNEKFPSQECLRQKPGTRN